MVHSMRKIVNCTFVFTLSLSLLAGCSSSNESSKSTEGNASDTSPMTLTFFGADSNANWNKMQDDVGKEITKQTGITLDAEFAVSDPAQRLALIAASGDYPDLISPKGDLDKLVDAGAMLDLTDLIDQHAPNIKKLFGDQIKRLRYSNEDPSIYVIPTYSAIDGVNFVAGAGFELQHRAVKEAGYPQIKTLQDYENVIRSYLEKHPTDENGNQNIGMTLNADDWHIQITVTNPAAETTGKSGDGEYYIDPETHEATYHFRTKGEKEYFQWLNHMYNTGLLDQESFVQKNDQYLAKVASGRVIGLIDADWGYSDGEKALKSSGKNDQTYGHYSVMLSDEYKDNRYQSTGFMAGWGVGITQSAEDPVRAIKFLDFLASEQGQILNYWGVEGKQYTMEDGKRMVPADVQQRIINDNIAFSRESGVGLYTNMGGHYGDGVKDSTGNYYTKNFPEQIIQNYTDVEKETLQAYDATTWMDLFPNEKDFPVKPWGAVWNISVPSDDEINIIANKVKDITWKQIPLAVMAKPEEFDAIWSEYQQKLIDAGVEKMEQGFTKYVQDRVKLWNEQEHYMMTNYSNPVIPGFYPDPSICRVDEDYYLVTSTFEYFPGVPLFHSKDLVNWRQIGHVLTSAEQLPLAKAGSSGGIYAPTLRHHEGWFYMTTTNVSGGGNFYVRSKQPEGPWSNPIFVAQDGIDPSLFFDDDGRIYFQSACNGDEGEGIYQCEIDILTGNKLTESQFIWRGTGGAAPEAPHLYKINGLYYLMIAEGGTEYGHMETIARSTGPYGPFDSCPHNPILSNRSMKSSIHATGHADLVQAHDGSWWAVCLGIRPAAYPMRHYLGRETFLAPVNWTSDGWPIIGHDGHIEPVMTGPQLPEVQWPRKEIRDDFNVTTLGLDWIFLRNPAPGSWSLTEHPGHLVLRGTPVSLHDGGSPAFVGRRLSHFLCSMAAKLSFEPTHDGDEAGLTVYMNEKYHYDLAITRIDGHQKMIFRRTVGSLRTENIRDCGAGPAILQIQAQRDMFTFSVQQGSTDAVLGSGETHLLSTEVAGGFTGIIIAMYAHNPSGEGAPSLFDWFVYAPLD